MILPTTLKAEVEQAVKETMGYKPGNECCKNCVNYQPDDMSGDPGALRSHCTLNPTLVIYVDGGGWCNFIMLKSPAKS